MEFFGEAISTLSVLVIALGAGLAVWGVINSLEGYGGATGSYSITQRARVRKCGANGASPENGLDT